MILLAEDDLNDAVKTRAALRAAGVWLPVVRTLDGADTIAYLKGEGVFADRQNHPFPSVLLLDLKMPRAHGFQVLDWISKNVKRGTMLVVAVSGFQDKHAVQLAYEMGAQSFLPKPCQVEDIRNLMKMHSRYWHGPTGGGDGAAMTAGDLSDELEFETPAGRETTAVARGCDPIATGAKAIEGASGCLQGTSHENS